MISGRLVKVNAENGETEKIETTGKRPNPRTVQHTSSIKENEMMVYGGVFIKGIGYWTLIHHKSPFKLNLDSNIWTTIEIKGFLPRKNHCSFYFKDYLIIFAGIDKNSDYLSDF